MENKNKSTKIILFVILIVILISVVGIVIFSINKNKNEVGKNEMTNSQNVNGIVANQVQNQIQDKPQNQVKNVVKNENVVIPTESEKEEPPRVVSTPSSDKDTVTGSEHTR